MEIQPRNDIPEAGRPAATGADLTPILMTPSSSARHPVRYGMTLRVRPERLAEYKAYHAAVWPDVLATISRCAIRNYSIYLRENMLFSYFEYWGDDFAADMQRMAADPATQRWWAIMEPMQEPYPDRAPGEWWSRLEEVFHHD
jgi:L-rhamnose mutarotase